MPEPLASLQTRASSRGRSHVRAGVRRALDVGTCVLAVVLLLPALLLAALAIKLSSPGPVLIRQTRHGRGGPFAAYQLRTTSNGQPTRVGSLLARLCIHELPQLYNVLRGDLPLFAPRNHATSSDNRERKLQTVPAVLTGRGLY